MPAMLPGSALIAELMRSGRHIYGNWNGVVRRENQMWVLLTPESRFA
ncbi:MAG TPA: hypothetical protein VGK21_09835 [Candidatus Angelobacter sp.]|jgi:hypothetical protein